MVGLIFYCIGAILAFGLMYAPALDLNDRREAGMVVVGTAPSWLTIVFIIYRAYIDARKDRKNPLP